MSRHAKRINSHFLWRHSTGIKCHTQNSYQKLQEGYPSIRAHTRQQRISDKRIAGQWNPTIHEPATNTYSHRRAFKLKLTKRVGVGWMSVNFEIAVRVCGVVISIVTRASICHPKWMMAIEHQQQTPCQGKRVRRKNYSSPYRCHTIQWHELCPETFPFVAF